MAEAVLMLSLASKILSTIASPAFIMAYQKSSSILSAKKDLEQLQNTIGTIESKLRDVPQNNQHSDAVKNWMGRIGDLLHEADDLFDEVATSELLKQQMEGNNLLKEVKIHISRLNPIISNYSIAKQVKDIRHKLESITKDESLPTPVQHQHKAPTSDISNEVVRTGWYIINPEGIVGRDDDLTTIKDFLLGDDHTYRTRTAPIIAVVGIGGIGKTTLARLIYNDDKVQNQFEKRWWVCISNTCSGKTQVLLRIFESIEGKSYGGRISQLEYVISKMVIKTREDPSDYLLILDDVWENDNLGIWVDIMSLLTHGAKGSKIIVTTKFSSVARAMGAKIHNLEGLSEDKSRELFRRIALTPGQEKDVQRTTLGDEIVKKCENVPLAIRSVAELLRTKSDIEDWKSINDDPNLQCQGDESIMAKLRLSFDSLPSDLKSCFAYCSLFPRNCKIVKDDLIYLWIAQGYVKPKGKETIEAAGRGYFNELRRRFFFQEAEKDKNGEIITCEMLGLYHQLAQEVAGSQSLILTEPRSRFDGNPRHLTIGFEMDSSWAIPRSWSFAERLRSSLFMYRGSLSAPALDELSTKLKLLRALDLEDLKIEKVSSYIGELKLLRYLNLSKNTFSSLPSSVTKLVNLHALDISCCEQLRALPNDFRKLISLTVLNARGCCSLMHMPPRFGELTSLECMHYFNVGEDTDGSNSRRKRLVVLKGLVLRRTVHGDRDECHQLPKTVLVLKIENPTMTMPYWDIPSLLPNLVKLHLFSSQTINCLPPLRCLSSLKDLQLSKLEQLQHIEEREGQQSAAAEARSSTSFFPCLESLTLEDLPNLARWSREVEAIRASQSIAANERSKMPQFPSLFDLRIQECPKLKSLPLSICLQTLELRSPSEELVQQLLSAASSPSSTSSSSSSFLTSLTVWSCVRSRFHFESLTSLQCLELGLCDELESLCLAPAGQNVLEELKIQYCPKLESYGQQGHTDVDWDSLPNLRVLRRNEVQMQREGHLLA